MQYKFLEHTADAKFQAYGKNIEEAFANAAIAMFTILTDTKKIEQKKKKKIEVKGTDLKALLVNFLEEFIYMLDADNFLLNTIENIKIKKAIGGYELSAEAVGDLNPEKYKTKGDIKAVTYNEMEIKEEKGNCMVQVVVDI